MHRADEEMELEVGENVAKGVLLNTDSAEGAWRYWPGVALQGRSPLGASMCLVQCRPVQSMKIQLFASVDSHEARGVGTLPVKS